MITAGQQIAGQANANKNKDVFGSILYNVKAYGAKGDGVTNDWTAIKSTLDYVKAQGGGTIFFPSGTYYVNSQEATAPVPAFDPPNFNLIDMNDIKILGTGHSVIQIGAGANISTVMLFYRCHNVEIGGMQFRGDVSDLTTTQAASGIGFHSCSDIYVHDIALSNFQGSYFVGNWIFNCVIERCQIDLLSGSGFDLAFIQNYTVRDCDIRGNRLGGNSLGTQGFQCIYDAPNLSSNASGETLYNNISNNVTLDNNRISGFRTGITLDYIEDCNIINNMIYDNYVSGQLYNWGIVLSNTQAATNMQGMKIAYNHIFNNGTDSGTPNTGGGIFLSANSSLGLTVDISHNDIFDNSHNGIYIGGSSNVTLLARYNNMYNRLTSNQTSHFGGFGAITTDSIVQGNFGYNPRSLDLLTPGLPAATGLANAVTNSNPFPVTIYQSTGTGIHIVTPSGTDVAIAGGNEGTFRLLPFHKVYFATANTTAWTWSGE